MEWALSLVSSFVLVLLLAPPAVFLMVLLALFAVGFLLPGSQTVSKTSFDCPFSKRRAAVEFLVGSASGQPVDVLSCSVFSKPYHVRCKKGCLAMGATGWGQTPMMPRFALLADGVSYRGVPRAPEPDPGSSPKGELARVA